MNLSLKRKDLIRLAICLGIVQMAFYYLAGITAGQGTMACPQPDTLLYCQAARRIAEGHPFSFAAGSAVSSGTTSILYPFLLAIPYLLGLTGTRLLLGGFLLNACCYLVFLGGWTRAFTSFLERGPAQLLATLLLALAAQPAFCAASQSDIGLWLAASGLFAGALAARRRSIYGTLLILGPWIRPEGMVVIIAFALIFATVLVFAKQTRKSVPFFSPRRDGLVLALAILSMAGVFAFNWALTGHAQFSSVAFKGYFKQMPFADAVGRTATDFLKIAKAYLFGLVPMPSLRDFVFLPILSSFFIWLGVFFHPWKNQRALPLALMLLAALGGMATVAQSGWEGTNFDRYLVWALPLVILFLAEGAHLFGTRARLSFPLLPGWVCLLFAIGCTAVAFCNFHQANVLTDLSRRFATEVNAQLPKTATLGSFSSAGLVYEMGDRAYRHLSGIYSPEFFVKTPSAVLEILKTHPELRFDYWLLAPKSATSDFGAWTDDICGKNLLTGPNGLEVRKANWDAFDSAVQPYVKLATNLTLVAQVDVGDEASERSAKYEIFDRYGRHPEDAFTLIDKLNGRTLIDAGRLLVGGDTFTIPLRVNKEATVVMRTYPKHQVTHVHGTSTYEFANPLLLNVIVNDITLPPVSVAYATNGFSDVSFQIPAQAIQKSPCRISVLGDHISCGYWFYQAR